MWNTEDVLSKLLTNGEKLKVLGAGSSVWQMACGKAWSHLGILVDRVNQLEERSEKKSRFGTSIDVTNRG